MIFILVLIVDVGGITYFTSLFIIYLFIYLFIFASQADRAPQQLAPITVVPLSWPSKPER